MQQNNVPVLPCPSCSADILECGFLRIEQPGCVPTSQTHCAICGAPLPWTFDDLLRINGQTTHEVRQIVAELVGKVSRAEGHASSVMTRGVM